MTDLSTSLSGIPYFKLAIAVLTIYLAYTIFYKLFLGPYIRLKRLGLSVPFPKPVFGNTLDFGPGQHIGQVELYKKYGSLYGTLFLDIPTMWIYDLEVIQKVMVKDFSSFIN